ncbi:nitrous oxide reductase accessory protein NosL [Ectobacillus polymachus]|uniref:nitrous oxide reductase accessory protein NosL n=1 Tax=Ectobacillus polymachus TaxID=1508806 RepID=UPI003A85EAAF
MKKGFISVVLLLVILTITTACGKQEVKPTAVDEKNDKCANCNMAVMNDQFATEVILENGKTMKFDDIGCMYKWLNKNNGEKIQAKFVRDYNSKEWVSSDKATYVYDASIKTPMAYNVISFQNKNDAESYLKTNKGQLLTYQDLNNHSWEMNKEMMKMMKDNNAMNHSH